MFFLNIVYVLCIISIIKSEPIPRFLEQTRRIIRGHEVGDTRPYMVYLRPAPTADAHLLDSNWLCGGVIIHERYILTSAACIEDVKHFYVISGTNRWTPPRETNECITNGAMKAIWKCVPKSYVYDGDDFDNIRWMSNDIAVVKVEQEFNFEKRIRGCDYIPKKIAFNNISIELEKPGTVGSIAGWGSMESYGDPKARATVNSPELLETDVAILGKNNCKKRWDARYHHIIDESMICAKDGDAAEMSAICAEREVNCKELVYSDEEEKDNLRRFMPDPKSLNVHTAAHIDETRRSKMINSGGFCENDHGGPLIHGHGKTSVVIGVITACLTKSISRKCYGPFLYTSVWKNRNLLSCAIDKDIGNRETCRRLLKSSNTKMDETVLDWSNHPDGPAKTQLNNTSILMKTK